MIKVEEDKLLVFNVPEQHLTKLDKVTMSLILNCRQEQNTTSHTYSNRSYTCTNMVLHTRMYFSSSPSTVPQGY